MTVNEYFHKIASRYKTGITTELSYRTDLQNLLETICSDHVITHEAKKTDVGMPDYQISLSGVTKGYIEAKDIGDKDLSGVKKNKSQFDRYKGFSNTVFTDYLNFHFYQYDKEIDIVSIGEIKNGKLIPKIENFKKLESLISSFSVYSSHTITKASQLRKLMAIHAKLMKLIFEEYLTNDEEKDFRSPLGQQYLSFKTILISDLTISEFSDYYAQTITYGLFTARMYDPTIEDFSIEEAKQLIPTTNPLIHNLFKFILDFSLIDSTQLKKIIEALIDLFRSSNVTSLLSDFNESTYDTDPIREFYEDFLSDYDAEQRKDSATYYTPIPVVQFQIKSVDEILKDIFKIKDGLHDISKIKKKVTSPYKKNLIKKEFHKIQILDPSTGTGTYIGELIKFLYTKFKGQEGIWNKYVDEHVLPRLNAFELQVAPYIIAHIKLSMILKFTGYDVLKKRLNIFLTNTLDKPKKEFPDLFMTQFLTGESILANEVKTDTPVMIVLGNPPYNVSSQNNLDWINNLRQDYTKHLVGEQNFQSLNGDSIKFIRYGQYLIDNNKEGILSYIVNSTFIDGRQSRGMRIELMKSFNSIYILNLHAPNLEVKNDSVFKGVKQETAIIFLVKSESKNSVVYYSDIYGSRDEKISFLKGNTWKSINWIKVNPIKPYYFFVPKDLSNIDEYERGFKLTNLFNLYTNGLVSGRDGIVIGFNTEEVEEVISDIKKLEESEFLSKYNHKLKRGLNSRDWKFSFAKDDLSNAEILDLDYRPFDKRKVLYSEKSKGILQYPRHNLHQHFIGKENIGLLTCKQQEKLDFQHVFISDKLSDKCSVSSASKEATYCFPLYTYSTEFEEQKLTFNYNDKAFNEIKTKLKLDVTEIELFDYIYAILHSNIYRQKYKVFLKTDFPIIPFIKNKNDIKTLIALGKRLRNLHLMESEESNERITDIPKIDSELNFEVHYGMTKKAQKEIENGKLYLNKEQYIDKVPLRAFEFMIGNYNPVGKYLWYRSFKRIGKGLTVDELIQVQQIINIADKTVEIQNKIDTIDF